MTGFYLNLPVGAVVLGGILFIKIADQQPVPPVMDAVRHLPQRLDLIGAVIFAGASIMLMLALQWGGLVYAWNSAMIIGLFCGSGAAFLVYAGWSWKRGDESLIPPKLIKLRVVMACAALTFFMMGSALTLSYWLPIYFQSVRGDTPIMSGVHMLPNILASVLFGIIGGILSKWCTFFHSLIVSQTDPVLPTPQLERLDTTCHRPSSARPS